MSEDKRTNRLLVLAIWVSVGAFYAFIVSGWIIVSMHDKVFGDYLTYVVDLAANERRPPKEIRSLLLVKAESLSIPLDPQQIQISGEGEKLRAVVRYQADVRVPLVNWPVYRRTFSHEAALHSD